MGVALWRRIGLTVYLTVCNNQKNYIISPKKGTSKTINYRNKRYETHWGETRDTTAAYTKKVETQGERDTAELNHRRRDTESKNKGKPQGMQTQNKTGSDTTKLGDNSRIHDRCHSDLKPASSHQCFLLSGFCCDACLSFTRCDCRINSNYHHFIIQYCRCQNLS